MFWIQCPFSILAGIGLFFSLSTPDRLTDKVNTASVWKKLRQIDYLGACLLVRYITIVQLLNPGPKTDANLPRSLPFFSFSTALPVRFSRDIFSYLLPVSPYSLLLKF